MGAPSSTAGSGLGCFLFILAVGHLAIATAVVSGSIRRWVPDRDATFLRSAFCWALSLLVLVIASRAGASDRVTFLVHGLAWPLAVGFVYRPGPLRSLGIGLLVLVSSSIATYLLFFLVLWVSSVR